VEKPGYKFIRPLPSTRQVQYLECEVILDAKTRMPDDRLDMMLKMLQGMNQSEKWNGLLGLEEQRPLRRLSEGLSRMIKREELRKFR